MNDPLILCVDDDTNARKSIARILKEAGMKVSEADGGVEALEQVQANPPDLVLLDVNMPGMDGYEVCACLQLDEQISHVPIIFVSGRGEEPDKLRALSVGAVDYVVKPFQHAELLTKIDKHLRASERWQEVQGDSGRRLSDFVRFKADLLRRVDADTPTREACAALPPAELYSFARTQGVASSVLASWIAQFLGLPFVEDIHPKDIDSGVLPAQFCKSNGVITITTEDGGCAFVMANPFDWEVLEVLRTRLDPLDRPYLQVADPDMIRGLFAAGGGYPKMGLEVVGPTGPDGPTGQRREARVRSSIRDADETIDVLAESDAPAVSLANIVIADAIRNRASDIHIEPGEKEVGLRNRLDGMLVPCKPIPKSLQASLISRIKIMARLDIAERRVPQDGRVRVEFDGRHVDLRISTLPTRHGEKIVMRLLDQAAVNLDLETLGFEEAPLTALKKSIETPHGVLLVTGPTGSGKTTTLYSALTMLNQPHANIVTIEDPVEFDLPQVNQVQVHPAAGMTFPVALRAILRQDPDIVMVGEIRDAETLDIAMKASLTGHLVLSTLHTNDAVSTISRLIDMGSEPFMVAATLNMVSAQRLLRKLCTVCREPCEPSEEILAGLGTGVPDDAQFYAAVGCPKCNQVGYHGRLAVAEVLVVDEAWRQLISRSPDLATLRQHAREAGGMATLRQNALKKAARSLTSLEEVLRVTI